MEIVASLKKLFGRKTENIDITIIKKESLNQLQERLLPPQKEEEERSSPADNTTSPIEIKIVDRQQFRQSLSDEELKATARELVSLTLPQTVRNAQRARESGHIDQAFLILKNHIRHFDLSPEIEKERKNGLDALANQDYFQRITNTQIARIFFNVAGFTVIDKIPVISRSESQRKLIENRLTVECDDKRLGQALETMASSPLRYYCYCLAEPEQALDELALGLIKDDFKRRARTINDTIHFAVCQASSPVTNMQINVSRFADHLITIPLEREEMRRAVIRDTCAEYLRSKVSAWMDNHRLFATTRPVSGTGEFFGRENDLNKIQNIIKDRQSFYLLGNRRTGKTSLIYHLRSLGAFRDHLMAFLSLEVYLDGANFDRATKEILDQCSADLQRKDSQIAQQILSQLPVNATAYHRLDSFLAELRRATNKGWLDTRCLVILDDMNFILPAPIGTSTLWQQGARRVVRLLRNYQDIVTTGLTIWDFAAFDILESGGGSGKYTRIDLNLLQRDECDSMVTYIGWIINMQFDSASLEEIFTAAGGHPLWTRMLCDIISRTRRSRAKPLEVTSDEVKPAETDFLNVEKRYFSQLLKSLSGAEQQALRTLADSYPKALPYDESWERSFSEALDHLKSYGLVEKITNPTDSYRLRARLLAQYLRSEVTNG